MKITILFASILLVILATVVLANTDGFSSGDYSEPSRQKRAAPLCSANGKDIGCDNHCKGKNQFGKCAGAKCVCKGTSFIMG